MAANFKLNLQNEIPSDATVQIAEGISISGKQHKNLLDHIITRLDWASDAQDAKVDRYEAIDREYSGFIRLDDADHERKLDTDKGHGPKAYDVSLQLTKTQIDEAVTYLMSVYFPEEGPYNAIAPVDKQSVAKGFTTLMNTHSQQFGHYRATNRLLTDALKYNIGIAMPRWEKVIGTKVQNDTAQQAQIVKNQVLQAGNEIVYLDPYNTLLDPSVEPTELHKNGEFFAQVEAVSTFRVKRMAQNKEIFNTDGLNFDAEEAIVMDYYNEKPDITGDGGKGGGESKIVNWVNYLTGTTSATSMGAYELVKVHIWLDEKAMGLSDSEEFAIWRIIILNGKFVVHAEKLSNAHGFLPLFALRPWDDNFNNQTQSFAEVLFPFQRFSSFQMNLNQLSGRKALYGVTFYNEKIFPHLANADLTASKVPFKPSQEIDDYRKHIFQFLDTPATDNTISDISAMDALMQKILPTDMMKQVTGLQRATQYQAAATVQGANRRNLKIAQIMESQGFALCRTMQVYNIMQFQQAVDVFNEQGETIQITPSQLRDEDISIVAGAGLRGLDKMIIAESLKDILQFLVQSPQAAAEADIMSIINYITSLIGDYTDFNQFKFKNEFDKLTPEQKQVAFQLLQQAMNTQAAEQGAAQGNPGAPAQ